jgi:site-specific DNA recombinase
MSNKNAAAYARSTKDRHDASIEAQLRSLRELAASQGKRLVREFTDAVFSGADENRPGFKALLADVRSSTRDWWTLYLLDTSRLSRRRLTALVFEEHECKRRGIKVVYKSVPESDPITEMLLRSILQTVDELHSMVSRAKGLAGMAENIHQGWRAGGRAPIGYRLRRIPTGAVRDGEPVTKSVLELGPDAPAVQAYLRGRARGLGRSQVVSMVGLGQLGTSSLVDLEWNALTYAGHTVWNRHADQGGGVKRRPRAEWLIKRDTHPALITDAEAESILARLESGRRPRYQTDSVYLLSGILETTDGRPWHGKGQGFYKLGPKSIAAHRVEGAVLAKLASDLRSPEFIQALVRQAQASLRGDPDDHVGEIARLDKERSGIDRRIERLTALLSETETPAPLLRQIERLETERQGVEDAIAAAKRRVEQAKAVRLITPEHVRRLLDDMAGNLGALPKAELKAFIASIVARVTLDPGDTTCCIHYRIPLATGDLVASPRRTAQIPCRRSSALRMRNERNATHHRPR